MDEAYMKQRFDPVVSDALVVQEQDQLYLSRWREFRIQSVTALRESETKLKDRTNPSSNKALRRS
jgi:hypothetical protein